MGSIFQPQLIVPRLLMDDARLLAVKFALEPQLRLVSEAARETLFLPRLNILDEQLLDVLAEQYHSDFYDLQLSAAQKRALIRDAILWHRRKGSPAAVEEVATKVFRDAHVSEWFQYGGEPYFFRIEMDVSADDETADFDTMNRLRKAVYESKNARSWLEYYGFTINQADTQVESESHSMLVERIYEDWYTYRRNNARYDGNRNYGFYRRHNGRFTRNGSLTRRGFFTNANHGQYQASDFEVINVIMELDVSPDFVDERDSYRAAVRVHRQELNLTPTTSYAIVIGKNFAGNIDLREELIASEVNFSGWHEDCAPRFSHAVTPILNHHDHVDIGESVDDFSYIWCPRDNIIIVEEQPLGVRYSFAQTVDYHEQLEPGIVYDRHDSISTAESFPEPFLLYSFHADFDLSDSFCSMDSTLKTDDEYVEPIETGLINAHQTFVRNGYRLRNGSFRHNGNLDVEIASPAPAEEDAWNDKCARLRATFTEPCPNCGQRFFYSWQKGAIRYGDPAFTIADPQSLTVKIVCTNCGSTIVQIPVD